MSNELAENLHETGKTMHELAKEIEALTIELESKGVNTKLEFPLHTLGEIKDPMVQLTIQRDALKNQLASIKPQKEFKNDSILHSESGVDLDWNKIFNKNDFDGNL